MELVRALWGNYAATGDTAEADCVMGHSFGTSITERSVNRQLADLLHQYAEGRPVIADRNVVRADPRGEEAYAHIIDEPITKMDGKSGTSAALQNAQSYMNECGLNSPIMVAQRYHIDRVVRQALKLGITSIVPPGLPDGFDKESKQIWTRSKLLFIALNLFAYVKLKIDGEL